MATEKRNHALENQRCLDLEDQAKREPTRGVRIRRILPVAATSVMAVLMALVTPAPAHAQEWDEEMFTDDTFPGGVVRFQADGDVVQLTDIQEDGHAVYLKVWDHTASKFKYDYTLGGEGRKREFRAALGGPYDLAEDHVFGFQICLVKNGDKKFCDTAYWHNKN